MADNSRKTPLVPALNDFATQKGDDVVQLLGKSLPVSVTKIISSEIVQVKFEVNAGRWTLPEVKMPVATSEYVRLPIQVGDKGVACPIDFYQGGVSGLGGGTADMSQRANLSTHRFIPVGNTNWFAVDNNALTLYGPNGVVIEDKNKKSVITLTPTSLTIKITDGDITITPKTSVTINGSLLVTGDVTAGSGSSDSVTLQHHKHSGVTPGSGDTDEPVPGT